MKKKEWIWLLFLFLLVIIFWMPLLKPGNAPFLRDLSSEIVPKRGFESQSRGWPLWDRFSFLGMPYAANPQSEAFYPGNIFYFFMAPERALVFYIVFHHLLFILTLYPALRRLGMDRASGLVATLGFGFGGYFISLSLLVVLLSTFSWLPLLMIFLSRAMKQNWLANSLLLGMVVCIQVLAGELEIAGQTWVLALFAVAFSIRPGQRAADFTRLLLAMALALATAVVLSAPQLALTWEMIPLSNRASGVPLSESLVWSLQPYALKSLVIPNYLLPVSESRPVLHWGLGFFSGYGYLLSIYLGVTLLLLALFAFSQPGKIQPWFWLGMAVLGILMAMGETLPLYKFFHQHLPGFSLFRIPQKFILFTSFSLAMLAGWGTQNLARIRLPGPKFAGLLILCGAALALTLFIYPLKVSELGNQYEQVVHYLMLRSVFRIASLALFLLAAIFLLGPRDRRLTAVVLGILVFADLYLAHARLNLPVARDFYQPNNYVRLLLAREAKRVLPVRLVSLLPDRKEMIMQRVMDPIQFFTGIKNTLEPFWAMHYGMNDVRAVASFYLEDSVRFRELRIDKGPAWGKLVMARAGVYYLYAKNSGFHPLAGVFPRALVFYHAQAVPDRDELSLIWSDPNFPARNVLLLETEEPIAPARGLLMSEPARVVEYKNELVKVEVEAREAGWLLLLDSYYPGWRAEVDGTAAEIYRANGFFRAVRVPAGRHKVVFDFHPGNFYRGLAVSGLGFLVWVGMMLFCFRIRRSSR